MGLVARIKTWVANEVLTAATLNAEFNNILDNLLMEKINDYSATVGQMQSTLDPGDVGTEVLATNSAEEVREIRAMLKKITGETYWYVPPQSTLSTLNGLISVELNTPANSIISGHVDANTHPYFLQADGATLNLKLEANPTNFIFTVANTEYSKSADDTLTVATGLAGKTAAWNDSVNTGEITKYLGEMEGTKILLTTVDAEISTNWLNRMAAFKTTNGADTEYLMGIVRHDGASYYLENCRRGFFKDSTGVAQRVELTGAQTFTLLTLSHIFVKSDGTLSEVSHKNANNEPWVGGSEPTSTVAEDRWFDTVNNLWNKYSSGAWATSGETLIGYSCQGDGIVEGARSLDFYAEYKPLCDISLRLSPEESDEAIENYRRGGRISVNGTDINYQYGKFSADVDDDMETGTVAADKRYYIYVTNLFTIKFSLTKHYDRQGDLKGYYHPFKPWRCVGHVDTDGSADFESIATYASEEYLADHSVTTRKLGRYKSEADQGDAIDINSIGKVAFDLTGPAVAADVVSDSFSIITNGRPIMLVVNSIDTVIGGVAQVNIVKVERRSWPDTTWVEVRSEVRGDLTGSLTATATMYLPTHMFIIDNQDAGQYEYRVNLVEDSAQDNKTIGTLYAFEM